MPLNWTTTAQQAVNHGVKVCVYGLSGAGKTRLIKTAPRPIIASAEAGTLSIAKAAIPMCEITSLAQLIEFYNFVTQSQEMQNFDTVCLDSITEIAERSLSEEKRSTKDPRKAYGEMMDKIAVQLRLFRDLPGKNVYFSAKAALQEQPDGTHMYVPSMPGKKTGEGLPYFFDEFFYLGVAEHDVPGANGAVVRSKYRYLLTQRNLQFEAKDRSGALDEIERPDLNYIFTKIRNAYAKPA